MEWKKMKFMERRIGEDFDGLIISVTKFGFFVELTDLFVEGLVPLNTLTDGDKMTTTPITKTPARSSASARAKPTVWAIACACSWTASIRWRRKSSSRCWKSSQSRQGKAGVSDRVGTGRSLS